MPVGDYRRITPRETGHRAIIQQSLPREYRSILRWLLDVVDYQRLNRSLLFLQFEAKILLQRGRERRGIGVQIGTEKLRVAKCEVVISRKACSSCGWRRRATLHPGRVGRKRST